MLKTTTMQEKFSADRKVGGIFTVCDNLVKSLSKNVDLAAGKF